MFKKIIFIVFCLFLYMGSFAWAACDGELSSTTSNTSCDSGDSATINSDVTLNRNADHTINTADNVTITNYGDILSNYNEAVNSDDDNVTINNKSTGFIRTKKSRAIWLDGVGDYDITNEGEIKAWTYCAICSNTGHTGDITINNSGTIHTAATNWSTGVEIFKSAIGIRSPGSGGTFTLINSGTIKSIDDNLAGVYVDDNVNATITNSGTIQGHGSRRAIHIQDTGTETGTTIKLSGEPTFTNGIELGKTITNIVLQSDITGEFTVKIYNYDNDLTITDNLSANYTYTLTEEDLDSDDADDDGVLTILTVPTLSSSSPADGATGVGVNDNIVLTFSEVVDAESGNIVIKKSSDDSIVETFDVTGSRVSGSGSTTITVDPSTTLDQATGYYITIDATAFDSVNSASYAGISDATTLNFNTGASNPLDDKDVVGSIEAQVDMAKQIIHHSTIPVLDRMEWLRRHKEENDLSHQGIKISFSNPMFTSISSVLPVSTYFNPTAEVLHNDWVMWTEGSVTIGKTSGTDSASLKDIESTGITIGIDRKTDQDLVHGFALRFGRDDVDVGSSGTSLDTDSYSLSIYRTDSYNEKTFLDSLLGISTLKTDLIRKSGANTLTGSRYGRQIFGSLSYSGVLKKDRFNLSPSVRMDGGYTNLSSYSETGKDALTYDAQNIKTGKISTGVLLDDTIQFSSITLRPNGRLEYGADFSTSSNAVLSYVSDPSTDYTLSVSKRALHNFRAGVGLDIETVGGLSVITSYEKNKALDSSYSDTVRLGIFYHHNANTQYALSFDGPDSSSAIFDIQTTSSGFNVNFKLEYNATDNMPHQAASLSLVRSF